MSIADLAAVLRRAAVHGAKVVVTGDPMQLQAVEGGGGMAMLARHLGHVQLSEASRFTHAWEREATLRLRDGDVTVLTDYRLHDRLHVGPRRGHPGGRGPRLPARPARGQGHAADGRDRGAGRRAVPPGPRGPDPVGHRQRRPGHPAPRRRPGLRRGLDHGPQERQPRSKPESARADAGQPGHPPHRRCRPARHWHVGPGRSADRDGTSPDGSSGRAPFLVSRSYLWNEAQLGYAVTFHAGGGAHGRFRRSRCSPGRRTGRPHTWR